MSDSPGTKAELFLASGSKQRLALLDQLGLRYQYGPMDIDEAVLPGEAADSYVQRLALEKARCGFAHIEGELPVLGADTTISLRGQILGKPENDSHAQQMLQSLSGSTHQVYTGTGIVWQGGVHSFVVASEVTFAKLSTAQINDYIATGEPREKAGSYAIQGLGAVLVEHISGSYSNIVGLPLYETAQLLSAAGIAVVKRPEH